jgi:hypothetical protein
MPEPNLLLGNPYAKPNPLSKPLYSPAPKPTNTTVSGVTVNTIKPVIVAKPPVKVDTDSEVGKGNEVEPKTDSKTSYWAAKTKKQKTLIIISVVAGVSLLAYIALKKK